MSMHSQQVVDTAPNGRCAWIAGPVQCDSATGPHDPFGDDTRPGDPGDIVIADQLESVRHLTCAGVADAPSRLNTLCGHRVESSNNAYIAQYALHLRTLHASDPDCTVHARPLNRFEGNSMANHPSGPSVQLRRLASELRALRESAQLSRQQVMDRTGINDVTLYRIERGKTRPQQRTLSSLLNLYGTDERTQERLHELASTTHFPGWIRPFRSLLGEAVTTYMSFESEASSARNHEEIFIPGLLQTEAYVRTMMRAGLPLSTDDDIETRVQARLKRQAVLAERRVPLQLWTVIDEAVLRRQIGSADLMAAQLRHLLRASERPEVTLQVNPFSTGAHPGLGKQFTHLRYDDQTSSDMVCTESTAGVIYVDSPAEVREYEQLFDHLCAVALSPQETRRFIEKILAADY